MHFKAVKRKVAARRARVDALAYHVEVPVSTNADWTWFLTEISEWTAVNIAHDWDITIVKKSYDDYVVACGFLDVVDAIAFRLRFG